MGDGIQFYIVYGITHKESVLCHDTMVVLLHINRKAMEAFQHDFDHFIMVRQGMAFNGLLIH